MEQAHSTLHPREGGHSDQRFESSGEYVVPGGRRKKARSQSSVRVVVGSPLLVARNPGVGIEVDKGSSRRNLSVRVAGATEVLLVVTTIKLWP